MPGEESIIFWIMALIFAASTIFFTIFESRKKTLSWSFRDEVFVSFITVISYVVMAAGLTVATSADGQPVYWTRWLFYIASCIILAVEVARIAGKLPGEKIEIAILTGLVMLCGLIASVLPGPERWIYFALSSAAYVGLLLSLAGWRSPDRRYRSLIVGFIVITWSLFPVVWALAPTGFGLISTFNEALLYGLLDIITKIGFGLFILFRVKSESGIRLEEKSVRPVNEISR